nr:MYB-like transcription factor ETC1 [Ipomoea batatas]GMD36908.1 MYB-like transcription factor ETC1 [Ipomoea batatas]GME18736.1 MYB-like transcription factor ETC1 [Ipomoea batatas]
MADLDTNSSTCGTEAQVDSIVEVTSKDLEKELVFSEDEEILITRMFNLVGESLASLLTICHPETKNQLNYLCWHSHIISPKMFGCVDDQTRWSLIAGRIPGRTAEEIEKYWNSRYSTSQ